MYKIDLHKYLQINIRSIKDMKDLLGQIITGSPDRDTHEDQCK